jgi:proline iminopeptidase
MFQLNRRELLLAQVSTALGLAACTSTEPSSRIEDPPPKPVASCPPSPPPPAPIWPEPGVVYAGGVRMVDVEGTYRVWTKKVGRGPIKVLLLHGGPGCTHEYFECFEDFLPQNGIEFYYYDQLGSAYSDQPDDPKLWTVDRFREEVEQVRAALGLEHFVLYGHSWGGLLAIEYALKYPQHLAGLVISNMTASIPLYEKHMGELRALLPPEAQRILEKYEAKKKYDAPEYLDVIMKQLYAQHLLRIDPWPEPVQRMLGHLAAKVYNTIQGPNEFVVTGNMKRWDRMNDLPAIKVPTQLFVGRYDEMKVEDVQEMSRRIPGSRLTICEKGSHLAMWDDQQTYMHALVDFLKSVQVG